MASGLRVSEGVKGRGHKGARWARGRATPRRGRALDLAKDDCSKSSRLASYCNKSGNDPRRRAGARESSVSWYLINSMTRVRWNALSVKFLDID